MSVIKHLRAIYSSIVLLFLVNSPLLAQPGAIFSLAPSSGSVREGTTINLTFTSSLPMPFNKSFLVSASSANPSHYSVPSTITMMLGATSGIVPVSALNDNVLFNNETLIVTITDPDTGNTFISTLTITDATSLNPQNNVVNIGNSTIYFKDSAPVTVSFPPGITSVLPTIVNLYTYSSGPIKFVDAPATVTIPAGSNVGTFVITASYVPGANQQSSAQIRVTGSSISLTVREGLVTVINDKLQLIQAVSPNGDPVNECLTISKITNYPTNTVYIFDRWGVKVWEKSGYDNNEVKFCGYGNTSNWDNKLLIQGIYYYYVEFIDTNPDTANPVPMNDMGYGFFKLAY